MLRAKPLEPYSSPSWADHTDPTERRLQNGLTPGWSANKMVGKQKSHAAPPFGGVNGNVHLHDVANYPPGRQHEPYSSSRPLIRSASYDK